MNAIVLMLIAVAVVLLVPSHIVGLIATIGGFYCALSFVVGLVGGVKVTTK